MSGLASLPEASRNRLLRRLDWRFLLGRADEPRVLCLAGGSLAEAATALWAPPPQDAAADLAVVAGPGRRRLAQAAAALRPGGELYAEWRIPRPGGARSARRRLEAAGFADVRCYAPWPSPRRGTQLWLPLDSREGLQFAARPRRLAGGRRRLLVELWLAAARLGLLAPLCAVARKPGGTHPPDEHAWLLLTGGRSSTNKVVALGFSGGAPAPELAVKFARSASEEEPLRREHEVLASLERARPALRGVPRPLFLDRRCGRLALGETALAGRPLLEQLDARSHGGLADAVTDWLVELAGPARAEPRGAWWERLAAAPLAAFERRFGEVVPAEELARARVALNRLPDLPLVYEQRDCAPWNLLVDDGGGIAVIDWESAEPAGLPGLDLVYFLTYAALLAEGATASGRTREAYAAARDPATRTGEISRRCETGYCERLGLDPGVLEPLRLLCWTVHAQSDYRALERAAAAPPERGALARSFFLALWRDELDRQTS